MLGRCDACLMHKDEHGNTCAIIHRQCDHCLSDKHHKITCAKDHPGSWILKQKLKNAAVSEVMPVFRCDNGLVLESISILEASIIADKDTQDADYSASGVIIMNLVDKN